MTTPYGFLPGTRRTATAKGLGTFALAVVEYVSADRVLVVWDVGGDEVTIITAKEVDFMPRKGNPPHGCNVGTYRTIGEDGPTVRVHQYIDAKQIEVYLGDALININPLGLKGVE